MVAIKTLLLEMVDERGASHIRELHIEILREKPGTPEHTIRARLSEAVADGVLDRLGDGFYDVYAEDEGMTSVVSYPIRDVEQQVQPATSDVDPRRCRPAGRRRLGRWPPPPAPRSSRPPPPEPRHKTIELSS